MLAARAHGRGASAAARILSALTASRAARRAPTRGPARTPRQAAAGTRLPPGRCAGRASVRRGRARAPRAAATRAAAACAVQRARERSERWGASRDYVAVRGHARTHDQEHDRTEGARRVARAHAVAEVLGVEVVVGQQANRQVKQPDQRAPVVRRARLRPPVRELEVAVRRGGERDVLRQVAPRPEQHLARRLRTRRRGASRGHAVARIGGCRAIGACLANEKSTRRVWWRASLRAGRGTSVVEGVICTSACASSSLCSTSGCLTRRKCSTHASATHGARCGASAERARSSRAMGASVARRTPALDQDLRLEQQRLVVAAHLG
eukprot:5456683-Prymnesium_polylepis.2